MKMKPEHYACIESAFGVIKRELEEAKPQYTKLGLSDQRYRWDAFRAAKIDGDSIKWLCGTLYVYLNDSHVDSALRHYFGHAK